MGISLGNRGIRVMCDVITMLIRSGHWDGGRGLLLELDFGLGTKRLPSPSTRLLRISGLASW